MGNTMAIHIELNVLFFLILVRIAYQSAKNENQQMRRVLFRYTAYGIMCSLMLDVLWLLIDGRQFPGGIALNKVVNALNTQPDAPLEAILQNVRRAVDEFVGGAEQFDDLTMMCVSYHGKRGS